VPAAELLPVAYWVEARHGEAGECLLSKGQPLESLYLLLSGSAFVSSFPGGPSGPAHNNLDAGASFGEAALVHSSQLIRSARTVVSGPQVWPPKPARVSHMPALRDQLSAPGTASQRFWAAAVTKPPRPPRLGPPQGCWMLELRYEAYDALIDPRRPMAPALPPGSPPFAPVEPEMPLSTRRAAAQALLCCAVRRLLLQGSPPPRVSAEAAELEPLLAALPPYQARNAACCPCQSGWALRVCLRLARPGSSRSRALGISPYFTISFFLSSAPGTPTANGPPAQRTAPRLQHHVKNVAVSPKAAQWRRSPAQPRLLPLPPARRSATRASCSAPWRPTARR
jgi:hypothetical protein